MKKFSTIIAILFFGIFNLNGQEALKNQMVLEIGRGGGDGIIESNIYGLHFMRSLTSRFDGFLKYNFSKGKNDQTTYIDKFYTDDNENDKIYTRFTQFYSVGLGLNTKLIYTPSSSLYINTGARYLRSNRSRVVGSRTTGGGEFSEITAVTNERKDLLGFEIGIGYKKTISQNFFVGGGIDFITAESRISASLILGTHF